jgi:isoleucyl-tRNA synthetase
VVVELSAFYVDIVKDRLYTFAPDSAGRRAAQTALWRIGEAMARLMAPIMSFTCDEVWRYLPKQELRPESVHLATFPKIEDILGDGVPLDDARQQADWAALRGVREQVLKALEDARNRKEIGKGLDAQVKLSAADPLYAVLERYQDDLRYVFIVSSVTLEKSVSGNGTTGLTVQVSKAAGKKCERCWNYSTQVGRDREYPTLCERCAPVVRELGAAQGSEES